MFGGYQVNKFLGRGGFGEVLKGEHVLTKQSVALKFMQVSLPCPRLPRVLSVARGAETRHEQFRSGARRHRDPLPDGMIIMMWEHAWWAAPR